MTATLDAHEEIGTFGYLALWDAIAEVVGDRECLVQNGHRQTWAQTRERTVALGWWLTAHTQGRRPGEHHPWESPNDLVGVYVRNRPEFLEAILGSYRARCAPFNVNYRYKAAELAYLLIDAAPAVLVYQQEFAPVLREALAELPAAPLLVCVGDDSGERPVAGSVDYEQVIAGASAPPVERVPSGDDVHVLYTGGTTGMPKGVIWRQKDAIPGPCGIRVRSIAQAVEGAPRREWLRVLPAPPLMHGTALWYAFNAWSSGGTVVLGDNPVHFDAAEMVRTLRRERVSSLAIVGDVFARPLLDAVAATTEPPGHLRFVFSSGAVLSERSWAGFTEHFPKAQVINALGSSETGPQANQTRGDDGGFTAGPSTCLLDEETGVLRDASLPGRGLLANGGFLPRGYLGDPDRTRATFRTIDGRYLAVSGDRAEIGADGRVRFLGRDSTVINTGGEKVYAEEVESVLLALPGVGDALVLGRPSERWGSEVVALVVTALTDDELKTAVADKLAGYKVPKAFLRVERVRRFDNGKPDYGWARARAQEGDDKS
ncbi:AMP-binding protein [Amycolatopsis sp. K13G38]|uniref:AMP-binding protein n=1 Tax=Amycolatopsis acididurans TaxID=2724524 RepID=A0ABX1JAC3_9PSEU|nr:AMP-binding protein [Amycolatopsis acididurans]NKQ56728.1 AMP-binding protein [Amycolatopsis acididurans]